MPKASPMLYKDVAEDLARKQVHYQMIAETKCIIFRKDSPAYCAVVAKWRETAPPNRPSFSDYFPVGRGWQGYLEEMDQAIARDREGQSLEDHFHVYMAAGTAVELLSLYGLDALGNCSKSIKHFMNRWLELLYEEYEKVGLPVPASHLAAKRRPSGRAKATATSKSLRKTPSPPAPVHSSAVLSSPVTGPVAAELSHSSSSGKRTTLKGTDPCQLLGKRLFLQEGEGYEAGEYVIASCRVSAKDGKKFYGLRFEEMETDDDDEHPGNAIEHGAEEVDEILARSALVV